MRVLIASSDACFLYPPACGSSRPAVESSESRSRTHCSASCVNAALCGKAVNCSGRMRSLAEGALESVPSGIARVDVNACAVERLRVATVNHSEVYQTAEPC